MSETGERKAIVTPASLVPWAEDREAGCLALVAQARGLSVRRLDIAPLPDRPRASWLAFEVGRRQYLYSRNMLLIGGRLPDLDGFGRVNGEMAELTANKAATRLALAALGGSVAEGAMFHRNQRVLALRYFRGLGKPACLKPNNGRASIGVHPRVMDDAGFDAAFASIGRDHSRILVEEHLDGTLVRFLYLRPSIVGVRVDRPPSVEGDGASTIAELVARKNADPHRNSLRNHHPIPLEPDNLRRLHQQGLTVDDIPGAGQRVWLSDRSKLANGADYLSAIDRTHPSYVAEIERLCRSFPAYRLGSLDVIVRDIGAPAAPGNHWILEMNTTPGLVAFYLPLEGVPQDIAGALLDRLRDEQW